MLPLSGITIAKAEEEEVPKGATMVSSSPLLTKLQCREIP